MRTTSNVAFYVRESKKDKQGFAPLEVSLSINGERRFFNLPMKMEPKDFNKRRKSKEIEETITVWRRKIDDIMRMMLEDGEPLTADNIRRQLQTGGVKVYTLSMMFDDHRKIIRTRDVKGGSLRKYEIAKELLIKYLGDIQASSVKNTDISDFYRLLIEKYVYSVNSAASYMAKIKSAFKYAMDNGKIRKTPFAGITIKKEKKNIEYLTESEIDRIKTTDFSTDALNRVRDVFLVQMYTGLSFIDLENLKKDDIQEKDGTFFIHKQRVKTGIYFTAVIMGNGIEILKKYEYKLPIISNQKTNSALKAIGREAEIDKTMHTHLGRKTYGHLLLKSGVRIEAVAKALGHSDINTTQKYYAELTLDSTIDEIQTALRHRRNRTF